MKSQLLLYQYKPVYFKDYATDVISAPIFNTLNELLLIDMTNFMLVGTASSGKTTILNTLIMEYFGLNDSKSINANVLQINNLKDQGINYYRNEVKTFCQTSCTIKMKKKILVLDDIDMINEQSQQVFRNLIDKYNHNILFISSCSNIQKVIESLQSRFLILKLPPITISIMQTIMDKIKLAENIVVDKDAEKFILTLCKNNIKVLINYLEKFKLFNQPINLSLANKLCCNINFNDLANYTVCLLNNQLIPAINIIYNIFDKGYSVMDILDSYFIFVKTTELLNESLKYKTIPLICKYITIFYNIHEDELELALFTNNLLKLLTDKL